MEDSVKVLEAMFNKAESDLDYVARKVDAECTNLTQGSDQVNPAEVLKRLEEIKRDYANVVAEAQAIQQAQKDALVFFQGQLVEMVTALTQLQQQTPLEAEKSEEAAKLENLLGISLPSPSQPGDHAQSHTTSQPQPAASHATNQTNNHIHTQATTAAGERVMTQDEVFAEPELSPFDKRQHSSECIDITDAEFNSVSQLVRGRAKLSEVNQTYRILWHHFKEEGNRETLNTQQMYKMGLRITGQTGEAKLKVLKSLKLLSLSKKGEVNLL